MNLSLTKSHNRNNVAQWLWRWLLVCALCALPACGPVSDSTNANVLDQGFNSPEAVVLNFFEDFNDALRDPKLLDRQTRIDWVDKLAIYFAPNERDDQRDALGQALYTFASGLATLQAGQSLKLEVRCNATNCNDSIQKVFDDDSRASVRLDGGTIFMQISRGSEIDVERDVPLATIIGRQDGTIPLIKIGRSWYLTESLCGSSLLQN